LIGYQQTPPSGNVTLRTVVSDGTFTCCGGSTYAAAISTMGNVSVESLTLSGSGDMMIQVGGNLAITTGSMTATGGALQIFGDADGDGSGSFANAKEGDLVSVRAFIVQTFEPRFFDSKKNEGEKGVLLNVVLDDGSATMRSVLFGENIKKLLSISDEELFSLDSLNLKRSEILGDEKLFTGNFRMNSFSNSLEFSVRGIQDFSVDNLIKELEQKV
jgi:hypothetical protein